MKEYEVGTGELERQLHQFYNSKEWKTLRNSVMESSTKACVVCGITHSLRVDHIKPVRHYWDLRLDRSNLQIMCNDCNKDKGSMIYWTLEEHKRYRKVIEIDSAITKLRNRKNSILQGLSEEWRGVNTDKPRKEPSVTPKPKTEILNENGKRVFRIRDFQEKFSNF